MPLTVYDAKEKNLTLSTGEQYLVYDTPTYVEVRQKKSIVSILKEQKTTIK